MFVEPDDEANARLIAAAPELLEACKAAKDQMEWAANIKGGLGHFKPVHTFLSNVIAQAEKG
ncbi:MAG: hypothetical protein ACTSRW_17865 [Candidatus Helarchaeota archaeon]